MNDPLLSWRKEFPILARSTYLVSHSLGAMPQGAQRELNEYARLWAERGVRAWAEGWWRMPVTVGDEIARIIGAPAGSVVMHPNVSLCQSLILSCFDFAPRRNKIVCQELDFPTVLYVYQAQSRAGARIHTVASEDGLTIPLEAFLAAIDEETLLVPVSHVIFKSAAVQDVRAIVARAHAVGALVVADLYQSAGTVPVDVAGWDVDFATGGSVKWLCGGPGAGYLYVAPRLRDKLEPRMTGWMAHARPFSFETGEIDYAGDVTRFLHGTPAVPSLYAARAGYAIVQSIGVEAIRAKSLRQVERLAELARGRDLNVRSPSDPESRGGMLVIDVPHADAVTRELLRREILVDFRPGAGIRISPHFYTTDDELQHAVDEIGAILDTGAYREHEKAGVFSF